MNYNIKPEKTAITNGISKGTQLINELYNDNKNISILDYGAGRLRNSLYLSNNGYNVSVLDTPLQKEKWDLDCVKFENIYTTNDVIDKEYDVVLCSYVLNVIPEYNVRTSIINSIYKVLKDEGMLIIEVRGDRSLNSVKNKIPFNDGFICGLGNTRTFQKPYSKDDIIAFVEKESKFHVHKIKINSDNILLICKK